MKRHDILVVGGGMAGLRAAIEASQSADTALLTRLHPVRAHSGAAQGGINAPLANAEGGKNDTPEMHAYDTVKGSDFLADQDAVELMCQEAAPCVYELEHWGTPFSRLPDGRIAQRPFGGAGFPRTCYAADVTGHVILITMHGELLRRGVTTYEEWQVTRLVIEGGRCQGVIALHVPSGELEAFAARAVIFATGGAGRLYSRSTNALHSTGGALGVAYAAGIGIKDMEFVQFHPTTIIGTNILMSEACRGEGGYLVNRLGERFMQRYAPKAMELAPRDIVSRSIQTEIDEGRGFEGGFVHLDLRHLGKAKIMERLPGIRDICQHFLGIDPIDTPIPIQPGQHYAMGGIDTDNDGASEIPGFYAAGEVACVSVHGANRLGGNSLLETVVFGKRAGAAAAQHVKTAGAGVDIPAMERALAEERGRLQAFLNSSGPENPAGLRDELQRTMTDQVGIFRSREGLEAAVRKIAELKQRAARINIMFKEWRFNLDLVNHSELPLMIELAEVVAQGALRREESRGSHSRRDFPKRDDDRFLWHTVAHRGREGPVFARKPVRITKWKPEERKY